VNLRRPCAPELQSAREARRLLPAQRLAGDAESAAALARPCGRPAALDPVGRGLAGRRAARPNAVDLWRSELVLFRLLCQCDVLLLLQRALGILGSPGPCDRCAFGVADLARASCRIISWGG